MSSNTTQNTTSSTTATSSGGQQPPLKHLTSQQLDALSADAAEFPEVEEPKEKPVRGFGDLPRNLDHRPTEQGWEKRHEQIAERTEDQMVATLETDRYEKTNN